MNKFQRWNQKRRERNEVIIEIKTGHFNILFWFALIGLFSIIMYVATFEDKHSDETKYYEGYAAGAKAALWDGWFDGEEYDGVAEPSYDELLDFALDSFFYEFDSWDAESEKPRDRGFIDGYIQMYMSDFIKGVNNRE